MAGLDWPVSDFSTLRRRQKNLAVQIPYRRSAGPLNLPVDRTGIKVLVQGGPVAPLARRKPSEREWLTRKHDPHRWHQYRQIHLAMDEATGDVHAVAFTPGREDDNPVLLNQVPAGQELVTGDGGYDARRSAAAPARNEILRVTCGLGRTIWKRWSGYHARSRIEAKLRSLKSFGERIASRAPDRQTAEIQIRVALINRFNALGQPEIERVV